MKLHLAIPYPLLEKRLKEVLQYRICPEVYLDSQALEEATPTKLIEIRRSLEREALSISLHAPYVDLSLGAQDPEVRKVVCKRFLQTLKVAEGLRPLNVVFHTGYLPLLHSEYRGAWLEKARELWHLFLQEAQKADLILSLENVFEKTPEELLEIDEEGLFCFDPAHLLLWGSGDFEEWTEKLGSRIIEVHLHNNFGKRDDHLPPEEGLIDFKRILGKIKGEKGIIFTLEVFQEEKALRARDSVVKLLEEAGWRI
jgi:sugar phosphate isomerase/epimerase